MAETVLDQARDRGMSVTMYRLGEVMADATTGRANQRSLLDRLARACVSLGVRPRTATTVDWTPVDAVGRLVRYGALSGAVDGQTVSLVWPGRVAISDVLSRLVGGCACAEVPYPEFHRRLCRVGNCSEVELERLVAVLPDPVEDDKTDPLASCFTDATSVAGTPPNTGAALAALAGEPWEPVSGATLDGYANALKRAQASGSARASSSGAIRSA